jgi:hypothetical protein
MIGITLVHRALRGAANAAESFGGAFVRAHEAQVEPLAQAVARDDEATIRHLLSEQATLEQIARAAGP